MQTSSERGLDCVILIGWDSNSTSWKSKPPELGKKTKVCSMRSYCSVRAACRKLIPSDDSTCDGTENIAVEEYTRTSLSRVALIEYHRDVSFQLFQLVWNYVEVLEGEISLAAVKPALHVYGQPRGRT
jgi:hypothetical protein